MKLSFDLTGPQGQALSDAAQRLRVRPEDLALAAVRDLIARPSGEFERVAEAMLTEHAELYHRLS